MLLLLAVLPLPLGNYIQRQPKVNSLLLPLCIFRAFTSRLYKVEYKTFGLERSCLLLEMSAKTRNRKRGVGAGTNINSELGSVDANAKETPVEDKLTTKRSVRSRKPIKIEVEVLKDEETSEYFSDGVAPTPKKDIKLEPAVSPELEVKPDLGVELKNEVEEDKEKALDGKESPGKKKAKAEPVKVEPPDNWETILDNIKIMRSSKTAVVDSMGCERTADLTKEPKVKVQRFHTLVSLMLSSQTKDQVTFAAMERLKAGELTVQSMIDIDEVALEEILKPVGFYRRKATYIKKTAGILRENYGDDIPNTVEGLCSLPGVGPKMAYICMNAAWQQNAGIGVDTHVHRISNRLKWTGKNGTNTPEKTREALESWMPRELWQEFNILLVGFGQETCLPIGPKCVTCLNKEICPASTARATKSKAKKK